MYKVFSQATTHERLEQSPLNMGRVSHYTDTDL